jgi:hypothetical protein
MKIEESEVLMCARHRTEERTEMVEVQKVEIGGRRLGFGELYAQRLGATEPGRVAVPHQAVTSPRGLETLPPLARSRRNGDLERLVFQLLFQILENLNAGRPHRVTLEDCVAIHRPENWRQQPAGGGSPASTLRIRHERYERHEEREQTCVSACGLVKTVDGREIRFNLDLSMDRQFLAERCVGVEFTAPAVLRDPLVINFDGGTAGLADTGFRFDLDGDGKTEQIAFAAPGSGFLALDLNGDGAINDGRELFGAMTGNGFTELGIYDADGNRWIDEGDPVFDRLRVWTRDADGGERLSTLAEKGVGAIYLGHTPSEFSLKDRNNALQGRVRATGLYLTESGTAGTVQQIDLAVKGASD